MGRQLKARSPPSADSADEDFAPASACESDTSDSEEYRPSRSSLKRASNSTRPPRKKRKNNNDSEPVDSVGLLNVWRHPASTHVISKSQSIPIRSALLVWYGSVKDNRGMPWRKPFIQSSTAEEKAQRAYEVWVSEVMLQQTQVATVIPYYNRWMEKFPTIQHLTSASIDDVNALWKGLGYYSRASRLLLGAQKVVNQYGGKLPDNAKSMQENIPGIGRYSAGAICSIAYGERVPVLDGNVNRLLSRFLALRSSPKAKATLDLLWSAAGALVGQSDNTESRRSRCEGSATDCDETHPGDINQALIELGSTVCRVQEPECSSCPINAWCAALSSKKLTQSNRTNEPGDIEDLCTICEPLPIGSGPSSFPMKVARKKAREEVDLVNVVEWLPPATSSPRKRQFLLVKRPSTGLLAGLQEFPTLPNVDSTVSGMESQALVQDFLGSLLGLRPTSGAGTSQVAVGPIQYNFQPAGDVKHVFSHIKKTYRVLWVTVQGDSEHPPLLGNVNTRVLDLEDGVKSKAPPSRKRKPKAEGSVTSSSSIVAGWVHLEQVDHANIGTGMAKVWTLAQTLWED